MTTPAEVLAFWFADGPETRRKVWFQKDPDFDAGCERFRAARDAAKTGAFDAWAETPEGTLALLILLDQLSRNLFRGSGEAFAADARALAIARAAVTRGFDRALHPVQRLFVYLPYEHAEDLATQDESVRLFESVGAALGPDTVDYAHRHRDVIRRFGRFPHRNAALGRANTPDEDIYLAQPGAGF
jgi:uncharacterized protein (DUF924 family)